MRLRCCTGVTVHLAVPLLPFLQSTTGQPAWNRPFLTGCRRCRRNHLHCAQQAWCCLLHHCCCGRGLLYPYNWAACCLVVLPVRSLTPGMQKGLRTTLPAVQKGVVVVTPLTQHKGVSCLSLYCMAKHVRHSTVSPECNVCSTGLPLLCPACQRLTSALIQLSGAKSAHRRTQGCNRIVQVLPRCDCMHEEGGTTNKYSTLIAASATRTSSYEYHKAASCVRL